MSSNGTGNQHPANMSDQQTFMVTMARSEFTRMEQRCHAVQNIQLSLYEKNKKIAALEQRCRFAESRLLEAEKRISNVMLQVYRDCSNLTTSLLLSDQPLSSTKQLKSGDKAGHSCTEDKTKLSCHDKHSTLISHSKEDMSLAADQFPPLSVGVSKLLLDKLAVELWKTKKELFSVLEENEKAQNKIPILNIREYEEIISHLEKELLILRCHYSEIRQACHHQKGRAELLRVIGSLQDQVRKQEKMISEQQSVLSSLSVHKQNEKRIEDTENVKELRLFMQQQEENETESDSTTKGVEQTVHKLSEGNSVSDELTRSRNIINDLKAKCQILGEQHEQTAETLRHLEEMQVPQWKDLYENTLTQLRQAEHQIQSSVKEMDTLKAKVEWLEDLNTSLKERNLILQAKHREDLSNFSEEKARYERNLSRLCEKLRTTLTENEKFKCQNAVLQELARRAQPSTCAQEVGNPFTGHQRLPEKGLEVDCGDVSNREDAYNKSISPQGPQALESSNQPLATPSNTKSPGQTLKTMPKENKMQICNEETSIGQGSTERSRKPKVTEKKEIFSRKDTK